MTGSRFDPGLQLLMVVKGKRVCRMCDGSSQGAPHGAANGAGNDGAWCRWLGRSDVPWSGFCGPYGPKANVRFPPIADIRLAAHDAACPTISGDGIMTPVWV